MRIRVHWFGRRGAAALDDEVETYRRRVCRRWQAEDVVHKPAAGGRDGDPKKALRNEARTVERGLGSGWRLAVLDEGGRERDSESFARWLADLEGRSISGLEFVIGSDLGLDAQLKRRADDLLSLSRLTLPHQIARLLLWEQLFRATHILGGGGYHRPRLQ